MPKQFLKRKTSEAPTVQVGDITAVLKRSARRRTMTIRVEGAQVQVRAPTFARLGDIENFLYRKLAWVQEKVALQRRQLDESRRLWRSGERVPLVGQPLYLEVSYGPKGQVRRQDDRLEVEIRRPATAEAGAERIQALVQQWFRQYAQDYLADRVAHWQSITGIQATGLCVKTYKARWGSCNHRREISFSWKLIMAPPEVIDYVVVHELCHIVHFDHSPAYWQLVHSFLPAYKTHKAWLRQHGLTLEL